MFILRKMIYQGWYHVLFLSSHSSLSPSSHPYCYPPHTLVDSRRPSSPLLGRLAPSRANTSLTLLGSVFPVTQGNFLTKNVMVG